MIQKAMVWFAWRLRRKAHSGISSGSARARSLPAEEWEALESKLREAFHNDQRTFLQRTPTYLDTGELYQLEILLQNSRNLRRRYCFLPRVEPMDSKTVRLTPEQGRRIIRILVQQGIHKISKIAFFWWGTLYASRHDGSHL